jgi:hypothetical protein
MTDLIAKPPPRREGRNLYVYTAPGVFGAAA